MLLSFIIYFESRRIENLIQQIRFIHSGESDLIKESELILVCQDECKHKFNLGFKNVQILNLNMNHYNKPIMNNAGAKTASSEILAILDSDRILPENYFKDRVQQLKENQAITASCIYNLDKKYTDNEINSFKFKSWKECRSQTYELRKKGMFSGNTLIHKKDYLRLGGMDERYSGYGYADIDFARTMLDDGMEFIFNESIELHLYHTRDEIRYREENKRNFDFYCSKWKESNRLRLRLVNTRKS